MEQDRIWDYFQNDESMGDKSFIADTRYQYLADQIPVGASALNIGVGAGGLERIMHDKQIIVSCLDPNAESIQKISEKLDLEERAQVGYSQEMPFPDNTFDFVIMSEVLEHLSDDIIAQTLIEVKRVLKPTGRFIGTVPADEDLKESIVVCPCCGKVFHRWGHVQSFSEERLQEMLTQSFLSHKISRHYFGSFDRLNMKGRISLLLKQLMIKLKVKGSNETFFFDGQS
jgi:ubiquinone/menaquinone biosynthesis C-methylase UbiE